MRVPASRWQIYARLVRSLNIFGDVNEANQFEDIKAGGTAAINSVQSAYVGLFRHVVFELGKERLRHTSVEETAHGSSIMFLLLSLLRALVIILTPSFLNDVALTNPCNKQLLLASGKKGEQNEDSSRSHSERALPVANARQAILNRSVWSRSNPTTVRNFTSSSKPGDCAEGIPVLLAAISLLGEVLEHEGDIIEAKSWGSGRFSGPVDIHYAAWQALCVVSIQICPPARSPTAWPGHVDYLLSHAGGGRFSSNPKETKREKHVTAGKTEMHQCGMVIQAVMSTFFYEAERVHKRLEELLHQRSAGEGILTATAAVRLIAGPESLPLPTTPTFPKVIKDDFAGDFEISFWIWIPDHNCVYQSPGRRSSTGGRPPDEPRWRATIFTHGYKGSLQSQSGTKKGYPGIFLLRVPPKEHTQVKNIQAARDPGGFYVEDFLLRRADFDKSKGTEKKLDTLFPASDSEAGNPGETSRMKTSGSSDGRENPDFQNIVGHSLLSECPLPKGQWTHVCCAYSTTCERRAASITDVHGNISGDTSTCLTNVSIAFNGCIVAKETLPDHAGWGERAQIMAPHRAANNAYNGKGGIGGETVSSGSVEHGPPETWGATPLLCDLYWHPRKLLPEQVNQMAQRGVRSYREDAQVTAEGYVIRLASITRQLAALSQRANIALASPTWLSLWLKLGPIAGQYAQITILGLLRHLLCAPSQSTSEGTERGRGHAKAPFSSGPGIGDRSIINHICGIIGDCFASVLYKNYGSDATDLTRAQALEQAQTGEEGGVLYLKPSIVSEVVSLLRCLVREEPARWREHVFASMVDGLANAAKGDLITSTGSPSTVSDDRLSLISNGRPPAWLGSAIAATYLGGGHIDGPRLGARVIIRPDPRVVSQEEKGASKEQRKKNLLHEVCPNICSPVNSVLIGEETINSACSGTVLGWNEKECVSPASPDELLFVAIDEQHEGCLDDTLSPGMGPLARPLVTNTQVPMVGSLKTPHVVAAPLRVVEFQAEVRQPATPFLFDVALPNVLTLLGLPRMPNISVGSPAEPRSTASNSNEASLFMAHIRCRLLRALVMQLRFPNQAICAIRSKIFNELLNLSATNLASTVVLALGSEGALDFSRRCHLTTVALSLSNQHTASTSSACSLMADLESACQVVWHRLDFAKDRREMRQAQHRARPIAKHKEESREASRSSGLRPMLLVFDGDAVVEGNRVTASSHFPTIRLSLVGVGTSKIGGRWYYEVTLLTGGLMQIGWAGPLFQCSPVRGQGVGDNQCSWAFDGFRQKRWCVSSASYGSRWRAGDVVGVLLDAGLKQMRFR